MIEISLLKKVENLKNLNEDALKFLTEVMQQRAYRSGDPIFNDNTEGTDLYLVSQGVVKVTKRAKEGEAQSLNSVKEGEFLGIMTFLAGGRHSANAVAGTDCLLLLLDRKSFERFVEKFPADAVKVYQIFIVEMVGMVRGLTDKYIDMVNYMWRWR